MKKKQETKQNKTVKITQIKSSIGYRKRTKNTLVALGINKINASVSIIIQIK